MEKIFLTFTVTCVLLTSCLKEPELKLPFEDFTPVVLDDGWEHSTPAAEGFDKEELRTVYRDFHASGKLWQVRSLLVFRNDRLVAESYTKDRADVLRKAPIWSCTKQIVGILTGIALDEGFLDDTADPLVKYLPETPSNKAGITLDELLTMQSGIAFSNDGFASESNKLLREVPENSVGFVLDLPILFGPGERFHYNDGDPHLISVALQRVTGTTLREWADDVLFSKIGFRNYDWATYKDGVTMGAFGISTTPRELARIGHLVLHRGMWQGERIVSKEWIERMVTPQVPMEKVAIDEMAFGYLWWLDEARGIEVMRGQGGQFVVVKPEKDLVVVMTADPNVDAVFEWSDARAIFDRIDKTVR